MKKIYLSILILVIFTALAGAQAHYSGGAGGGYASTAIGNSTSVFLGDSLTNKSFDVTIFPNPLTSADILKAKLTGINQTEKVSIVVTDMIGTRLLVEKVDVSDEIVINLPFERLSKGIYLITFQYNNHKITRRFNFSN
jgi:hypothetical protein